MKKLLVSAVVTASFALVGVAPAAAQGGPPFRVDLPSAACNQGTDRAQEVQDERTAGELPVTPSNRHVPHDHGQAVCMTMPSSGQPGPINP